MNLSRPDRRERLARLAAEYALGTSPPRVRRRLVRIARRDPVVAQALALWERRIAVLGEAVPGVTPPPRVWRGIAGKLGLDAGAADRGPVSWWNRAGLWRGLAAASLAVALALAIVQLTRLSAPASPPLVVVLAGSDARPALIATATRGLPYLTIKAVIDATPAQGKSLELWALPGTGAPRSLGVIPAGAVVNLPLRAPAGESLANIPALAVSLEPAGGSPTGLPTGPVLYSGKVERMY